MNKEALTPRPLSPEEKQEHGYNVGKGVYSALQLKNILLNSSKNENDENQFVIKIPKEKLLAIKKSSSIATDSILKPSFSAFQGFKDTSNKHIESRKEHLKKQLEEAQHEYLKALTQTKKASLEVATPNVDAMCLGMLAALEKDASESISDGSVWRTTKNIASSLTHPVSKHIPTPHQVRENLIDKPLVGSMLAMYLVKHLNKKEQSPDKSPLNISVEAI